MITFVLIAAAMVAAALAWVLVPLLRTRQAASIAREASNVAILRDQLRELDADLATGTMPREQYEQARRELEQRVLDESRAAAGRAPRRPAVGARGRPRSSAARFRSPRCCSTSRSATTTRSRRSRRATRQRCRAGTR